MNNTYGGPPTGADYAYAAATDAKDELQKLKARVADLERHRIRADHELEVLYVLLKSNGIVSNK